MNRILMVVLLAGAILAVPASPASAHATLLVTSPSDGAHLVAGPEEVSVTFDEAVEISVGAVRVFDSDGVRVDRGDSGAGDTRAQIRVSVSQDLAEGAYVATWRAVSLDGHPVRGAFIFHVGHGAGEVDPSLVATLLGEGGEVGLGVAGAAARWVTYTAGLIAIGVLLFLVLVGERPSVGARLRRTARTGAVVGIVGSLIQVPLFAAEATGLGAGALTSAPALIDAVTSPIGRAALMRSLALGLLIFLIVRVALKRWVWVGLVGVVTAELLVGHTLTTEPRLLVIAADAVHVTAAAFWLGGLVALFISLREARQDDDPVGAAAMVGEFSKVASWSVVALGLAGVSLAWAEVRAVRALTSTAFGWTLLVKTILGAAVLGVGAYNNRVLVPAIARMIPPPVRPAGAIATMERTTGNVWGKLGRTVRYEVVGLLAVLAVTAVLVNLPSAAEEAGVSGPFSTFVPFGEGQLNLTVTPNRVGSNEIHVYVLTSAGLPADVTGDAAFEFGLPAEEIGPIVRAPLRAGSGHWTYTGPDLAIAGVWEITFRLTEGFDEDTATVPVTVNP